MNAAYIELDMQALVPGLQACSHLVTLQVDGNPVSEEANSRYVVECN